MRTKTAKDVIDYMDDIDILLAYHDILCGDRIDIGNTRAVYECNLNEKLVVKIEHRRNDEIIVSDNIMEWNVWKYVERITDGTADWFAPCVYMSSNGKILLQEKIQELPEGYVFPDKIPNFFTDIKRNNFGLYKKRLVCCDYSYCFFRIGYYGFNKRMQKVSVEDKKRL